MSNDTETDICAGLITFFILVLIQMSIWNLVIVFIFTTINTVGYWQMFWLDVFISVTYIVVKGLK